MSSNEAFDASLFLADKLVRGGEHADAITAMHPWIFADIDDFKKVIVSYNMAQVFSQMGQHDEALAWCDYGIALEVPLGKTLVAEGKAALLHAQGRLDEAGDIWRGLLAGPLLDADGRRRVTHNLGLAGDRG